MKADVKRCIDRTFERVKINEHTMKDWQKYVPAVIRTLRHGSELWLRYDESFHKSSNKIYKHIYHTTRNWLYKKLRELRKELAIIDASDNEQS